MCMYVYEKCVFTYGDVPMYLRQLVAPNEYSGTDTAVCNLVATKI